MRITGFAEGFDAQAMVEALMAAARVPIETTNQLAYEQELKLVAWDRVEANLGALRGAASDLTSLSTWQQMATTSSSQSVATLSATSAAAEGSYSVHVSQLATSHRVGSDAQADITSALGLEGTFTVGGQEVTVEAGASLENIRDAINLAAHDMAEEDAVEATIVDTTLVLTRRQTGTTGISLADGTGDVLETLGVLDASKAVKNELQQGKDMQATVMNIPVTRSSNTGLDDIITGVTLDIVGEGDSTLTVGRDRSTVKSLINSFIGTYNATMEAIEAQGTGSVEGDDGFVPATLQGDSLLRSILSKSRSLITATSTDESLDETLDSLRKIGIATTGKENRLSLVDSEALDEALERDFDAVEDLFRSYDGGIMREFEDHVRSLTSAVDGAINRRQESIQNKVDRYDEKIAKMERSLESYEEQLWNQFTAMETTIAMMQQQSQYLTSILAFDKDED